MIITIFILYWSISLFFFLFPQLIFKRKKHSNLTEKLISEKGKIALIAHRGGSRENLENTMEAF